MIHRCDMIAAAAPVSTVFPCFPLQGLSCGQIASQVCCPGILVITSLAAVLLNSCGGLFRWAHLALGSTWEGAPCQVGTRSVKLAGLSSKSTCNICCIWSSGWMFGLSIPVSSLQYQLIGKLLGGSCFPVGELSQN